MSSPGKRSCLCGQGVTEWRDRKRSPARRPALKERERDDREDEIARLKSKVGEITMDNELLSATKRSPPWRPKKPFGPKEVETMSQTVSPSTSRCYGLARVSRAWSVFARRRGIAFSSERHRLRSPVALVRQALVRMLTWPIISAGKSKRSDFHGEEGYRKLWARLRVAGRFAQALAEVRRVMGENGLLAPHRVGRNQEKMHDGTIVTGQGR